MDLIYMLHLLIGKIQFDLHKATDCSPELGCELDPPITNNMQQQTVQVEDIPEEAGSQLSSRGQTWQGDKMCNFRETVHSDPDGCTVRGG